MDAKYNKVIGIQCYGTSGTTLMHSLLDNHQQVLSLPYLHGRDLYTLWNDHIIGSGINVQCENDLHEFNNKEIQVSVDLIIGKIKLLRPYYFDHKRGLEKSLARMGEHENIILTVNPDEFSRNMIEFFKGKEINRKNFIVSIYVCYNKCFNIKIDKDPYLCLPIHDLPIEIVSMMKEDFEIIKAIHMVRNPVQSMGSIIKHINYNQHKYCLFKSHVFCAVSSQLNQVRHFYESKPYKQYGKIPYFEDSKNYESFYIRLEDVHNNLEDTMKKITKKIGIKYSSSLLKSTFMGYKWFNRAESIKVSGVNKKVIEQKHNIFLNKFDNYRLFLMSKKELDYFSYGQFNNIDKLFFLLLPIIILLPFKLDFNSKTFLYRISAMFNVFSTYKIPIINWIIFSKVKNTIFGPHLDEMSHYFPDKTKINFDILLVIRLFNIALVLPIFIIKIIYNYINFRFLVIYIWLTIIFQKHSNQLIKPL
tara:strand:+ start:457 stop:1881 length:1425 start_codon:yes stop_codon:yes gene_type:complete